MTQTLIERVGGVEEIIEDKYRSNIKILLNLRKDARGQFNIGDERYFFSWIPGEPLRRHSKPMNKIASDAILNYAEQNGRYPYGVKVACSYSGSFEHEIIPEKTDSRRNI